jgi:hypothetical protein
MVHFERVYDRISGSTALVGYVARVRIRVRAGNTVISREGSGWGWAVDRNIGAAHEKALKTAETDATKRALSTFGAQFGLTLYDKEQNGAADRRKATLTLFAPDGKSLSDNLSPEAYCSGLRQLIQVCRTIQELDDLARYNAVALADLRNLGPSLRNGAGIHFTDLLLTLLGRARLRLSEPVPEAVEFAAAGVELVKDEKNGGLALAPVFAGEILPSIPPQEARETQETGIGTRDQMVSLAPSKIAAGPRIDKSSLVIGSERRIRDKMYLKQVSGLPCTICGRQPSHAHHLRFAQPRGLSQKVSDEYVVPLCGLHHGDLHHSNEEATWWKAQKIDPIPIAAEHWARYLAVRLGSNPI